ncbi:MAG: MBOAT family O-acyltransferase [bacterium]|nr:MBOAT family O-acyltransferase [bacterium]
MLFTSPIFFLLVIFVLAVWPAVAMRRRARHALIAAVSLVFYGWWDWRCIAVLVAVAATSFLTALAMERSGRRNRWLVVDLTVVLGLLVAYKYADFLLANLAALTGGAWLPGAGGEGKPGFLSLAPIGISFYTFQSLTYTFEVHRGKLPASRDPLHYFAFLSFFPQLLAGPINRAALLMPQLATDRRPTPEDRWAGLKLLLRGYFMKAVVSDGLAPVINAAFALRDAPDSSVFWWLIVAGYAVQIYADFSGYTDIARGLARLLGYEFAVNFNRPYFATSISEFWTRWHMSLSTWLRDYLFMPTINGILRRVAKLNLATVEQEMRLAYPAASLVTMLLCGLWHGAGWTFILWGGLHAVGMSVEQLTRWPKRLRRLPAGRVMVHAALVLQILVTWVVFRSASLEQAAGIIARMFAAPPGLDVLKQALGGINALNLLVLCALGIAADFDPAGRLRTRAWWPRYGEPLGYALILAAAVVFRGPGARFIYFQF